VTAKVAVVAPMMLPHIIIAIVAKTGGHLAPSLGVIELTLAMMKVYDFEEDKLVWDVGHLPSLIQYWASFRCSVIALIGSGVSGVSLKVLSLASLRRAPAHIAA
jgi:hypothetical protein